MKLLLPLVFLLPFFAFPQGQANNWYFGNQAGLDFNTSPPSVLLDGHLSTNEGCSSISDANGNLLFYTDGRTIWNAAHQKMPNADYLNDKGLYGDPSSTSSGLIVPHPGNPNQYFVFTVDEPHHQNAAVYPNKFTGTYDSGGTVPQADDGRNNGFNYSIVDMTLENGMGDVIMKKRNIHLVTYDPNDSQQIKYKCSEKITAVNGGDCNSIWVLTHFVDKFYAFKVDDQGVDPNPVISTIGPTIPTSAYRRAAIGYLKASPDGEKLLIAHQTKSFNSASGQQGQNGGVYLYDFDNLTGQVSNEQILIENINAYGVEFSAESKKAYATLEENGAARLYQWDLEASNIPGSIFALSGGNISSSALQLAPNKKIYLSLLGNSVLGVINKPELSGNAADYTTNISLGAIDLQGRTATFGLPPFIQSIFSENINIIDNSEDIKTELKLCDGESHTLGYDNIPGATYTWFKNDILMPGQTSPTLNISQEAGTSLPQSVVYNLEVDLNDGSCPLKGVANVVFYPYPQVINTTYEQCALEDSTGSYFNLNQISSQIIPTEKITDFDFSFYHSLADAQSGINEITNADSYQNSQNTEIIFVRVAGVESGCEAFAEVELIVNPGTNNFPPIELTACSSPEDETQSFDLTQIIPQITQGNSMIQVEFYSDLQESYTETNPIQNPANFQSQNTQNIYARTELNGICQGIYNIQLIVDEVPFLPADLTGENSLVYCLENYPEKIILSSGIPENEEHQYTFLWQPMGETTPRIEINTAGKYTVQVTKIASGCTATRTIEVIYSEKADFNLDVGIANTIQIVLNPANLGDYEYSLDNIDGPYQEKTLFESVPPGRHTVYARDRNACGISHQNCVVYGIMKFFTPNGDGINDKWTFFLNVENFRETKLYIYDRYGKTLHVDSGNSPGWDGMYNGNPMPANDYWYHIVLENGQVLRGNFSLIR